MKQRSVSRYLVYLAIAAAVVFAWLRFMDSLEPDVDDGEQEGEFDPDLPHAQPGDVLLFNRARGLNRLITAFTRSPYYHVGISLGDNRVVEARPRGVVIRDLLGPDGDKRFEIIPAERIGGRETALRAAQWAKGRVGAGYDPFNVLAIVLDRGFACCAFNATLPDHWACGEFVAAAFEEGEIDLFPGQDKAAVVPADFARFLQ